MNKFKEIRLKYKLTQPQMSAIIGVPARTIQNWEGGVNRCPEYVERMILDTLDRKLNQPDYKSILEDILEMLERDLKYIRNRELGVYVQNLILEIKDSMQ